MAKLSESVIIEASLAEVWELYFEPRGWPAWVDGFTAVEASNGYPGRGGTLVWRSTSAGRGTVDEQVVEHEPRRRHRIEFSDPESRGELLTEFAIDGDRTRVDQTLEYRLARPGPFAWVTERLFVRGQVRESLRRSLSRLKHEAEEGPRFG
jgi:uncharacterized membrane protein